MYPSDHSRPLRGEEARLAAAWLEELRQRLTELQEQMPEDLDGVPFEVWMEQYLKLSRQIALLEQSLS